MQLLFDRLRNQPAVQNAYRANPSQAVSGYGITEHERDAVVTKDLDDLVAIGLAASIEELPEVVRGTRAPGSIAGGSWLLRQLERVRQAMRGLRTGGPTPGRPDIPKPEPRPIPRPGPLPGPDPPGPDPPRPGPGPDLPGGGG
jgi:hypothetical protein